MKKIFTSLLISFLLFFAKCMPEVESNEIYKQKNLGIYPIYTEYKEIYGEVGLTEFEEYESIPYIEINEAIEVFKLAFKYTYEDTNEEFTIEDDGYTVIIRRENGSFMRMNAGYDNIYFSDYQKFIIPSYSDSADYLFDYPNIVKTNANVDYIYECNDSYAIYNKSGITIDFSEYNIDIIKYANKFYIPFQTISDLFYGPLYFSLVKLKSAVYLSLIMTGSSEYVESYNEDKLDMNETLLQYNYNEMCFLFDYFYNKEHDLSFDDFCIYNNLKDDALETASGADYALQFITNRLFDDLHSTVYLNSPSNDNPKSVGYGKYKNEYIDKGNKFYNLMSSKDFSNDYYQFKVIDNTAYIYFRVFDTVDRTCKTIPTSIEEVNSASSLFLYAYSEINKNDNIDNVVIDLSYNGGGDTFCLMYLLGFIMNKVYASIYDSITDAYYFSCYQSDTNLDGVINDEDHLLLDKNIYVLTSPLSYSCANEFSTIAKEAGVTIIGQTSGGGSCVVGYMTNAIGTTFSMSSYLRNVISNNGIYTHNDFGADVDIYLDDKYFFDYDAITDIINNN